MSMSCDGCLCQYCLYFWSWRCPFGQCRDDWRAIHDPRKGEIRKTWSDWNLPLEQEHYCRGGFFVPAEECECFVQYEGQKIEQCHAAMARVFQDNFRVCSMMQNGSCENCLRELTQIAERGEKENEQKQMLKNESSRTAVRDVALQRLQVFADRRRLRTGR